MSTEQLLLSEFIAIVLLAGVPIAWAIAQVGAASDADFLDELEDQRAQRRHF